MDYIKEDFDKIINNKIENKDYFDNFKLYELLNKISNILLNMNKFGMNHLDIKPENILIYKN